MQLRRRQQRFIFDPSLVLYLPLYKLDGASIMSEDAYGRLCTVTDATWGIQGRTLDGINDKIVISSSTIGNFPVTFLAWVNMDSAEATKMVVSYDTGGNDGWRFAAIFVPPIYLNVTFGAVASYNLTTLNPTFGVWNLVGCYISGNGGTTTGYLIPLSTGVLATESASVGTPAGVPSQLVFGYANTLYFKGILGEVWIYNRALSVLEIQRNYLATKFRYR